jgi:putative FmdB family regulatory protein
VPTYQYACTECAHSFEQFQSFTDDALTVCPECQGRLRKVFNAVGVVFKGSGFYRTDSRASTTNGSSESRSSEGSSTSTEKSGGKSETKTDAKPAKQEAKGAGSKGDSASKSPAPAASSSG